MSNKIEKHENKITEIIGKFEGKSAANLEQTRVVSWCLHKGELNQKQLKELAKVGDVTLNSSGSDLKIVIISDLK